MESLSSSEVSSQSGQSSLEAAPRQCKLCKKRAKPRAHYCQSCYNKISRIKKKQAEQQICTMMISEWTSLLSVYSETSRRGHQESDAANCYIDQADQESIRSIETLTGKSGSRSWSWRQSRHSITCTEEIHRSSYHCVPMILLQVCSCIIIGFYLFY